MNEQKLTKYLASYKEWLTKNPSAANEAKQEDKTVRLFKMSCFPSISLTLKVGFYSISKA